MIDDVYREHTPGAAKQRQVQQGARPVFQPPVLQQRSDQRGSSPNLKVNKWYRRILDCAGGLVHLYALNGDTWQARINGVTSNQVLNQRIVATYRALAA